MLAVTSISYGEEGTYQEAPGKAAIVMDVVTGRILYEKNIHTPMAMASTTKIMTALLAIENAPLDHVVKVKPEAVGIEGSSIYLRAQEKVSLEDLLYGMMLRSGNDAAAAIALEIGGTMENFIQLMNQRAKELGAMNTNFVNPHGLYDANHYTTAYDLALITRAALMEPSFKKIVATKFWTANRDEYKHFANKNKILSLTKGGDGVKTGYTIKAGRCLVASATQNGQQLIAVTLNDYNWFHTADTLLQQSFAFYQPYPAIEKDALVREIPVIHGKKNGVGVVAEASVTLPLRESEIPSLRTEIDLPESLSAPVAAGQPVGRIRYYLGEEQLAEVTLSTEEEIPKLTLKDRILRFFTGDH